MSAVARARAIGGRFGWPTWLVITGSGGIVVGSLAQSAAGTLNVNGATGAWPVLLLGTVVCVIAAFVIGPGRAALERWQELPIGIAVGLLVVALLDLAELARGIDDAIVGGLLGSLGRVIATGSAAGLLVGVSVRRRAVAGPSWMAGLRATSRYHLARLGGVAVVAGWVVLVTQGQGFAIRSLDALGLVVIAVLLTGLGTVPSPDGSDRSGRTAVGVLATIAVVIGLDTAVVVLGHLDPIVRDGPATLGGYALYLTGVVVVGIGGVNGTIGLRRPRRAVPAPA